MKSGPILCLALSPAIQRTLFMDVMRPGEVNRAQRTLRSAAGKGVNVAVALARLGHRARLVGLRGGPSGAFIAQALKELGVDAHWVETDAETRHCHTAVEAGGARITEWVEEASPPTEKEWTAFDRLFDEQINGCSWLAISGALPPGAPIARLADIACRARAAGAALMIDSQGEPLRVALRAAPEWVKLNTEELEITTKQTADSDQDRWRAMTALREMGARNVLLTAGAEPCFLLAESGRFQLMPPRVNVLNPIGSGDSVTAGILHALSKGQSAVEAAAWGLACGSANAMTEIPALFDLKNVVGLREQVEIAAR